MCDIYTATAVLNEPKGDRKMDIDKETVQVVAVVGGVIIAVAALLFDGELGYAMGTGIMTIAGSVAGYIFGKTAAEKEGP